MSFDELCSENVMLYAIKVYDKPNCIMSEFKDDMKRFNYLKRLFYRHRKTGEIKERLILNHIIILGNLFGIEATTKMLFFKLEKKFWPQVKAFLVFLNYMPIKVIVSPGIEILDKDIPVDEEILETLKKI